METPEYIAAGERRALITIVRVLLANDTYRAEVLPQLRDARKVALTDMASGGLDERARHAFESTFEEVMRVPSRSRDPAEGAGA